MTDDDDRAEQALRAAFERRASAYGPVVLDLDRPRQPSRVSRLVRPLAAAAAVLVLAGGVALGQHLLPGQGASVPEHTPPDVGVALSHGAVPPEQVVAANARSRRAALDESERALTLMPVPEGAERVQAGDVPPLERLNSFITGSDESVVRSAFWLVPTQPQELARWYAQNPPSGMKTEGGPTGIGGTRNDDGSWSREVSYDPTSVHPATTGYVLIDLTRVWSGSGVRISVFTTWAPARATTSLAPDDVVSVQIQTSEDGSTPSRIVSSLSGVARLVHAFNTLPGTDGGAGMSCPYFPNPDWYRLTFVSPSRTVSATLLGGCVAAWQVKVEGSVVEPLLADRGLTKLVKQLSAG